MEIIEIELPRTVIRKLKPLFNEAAKEYASGKRGGVFILQPYKDGIAHAGFLPEKEAKKVYRIVKKLKALPPLP